MNVQVKPGDMISSFTREQAENFPYEIKAKLVYGNYREPEGFFDAALVLGGANYQMESRAKAAAGLYHKGQANLFITTGGVILDSIYGEQTEARVLKNYMIDFGVPAEQIITEDCAGTTKENMSFSREILKEHFGSKKLRIATVTSYFHVVRSVKLASAYLPEYEHIGVRAEYPLDNPEEFTCSEDYTERVKNECGFMWSCVNKGIIPDFSVL